MNELISIPKNIKSIVSQLDAESFKTLFMMVFEAEETRELPKKTGNFAIDLVSEMICSEVIKNADKYDNKCKKNAENAKKGGRPPKTVNNTTNNEKPVEQAVNDNTDDKEKTTENTMEKEEIISYGQHKNVRMTKSENDMLYRDYEKKVVEQMIKKIDEWSEEKNIPLANGAETVRAWLSKNGIQADPSRKKSWSECTIEEREQLYPDRDKWTGGYLN